VVGLALALSTVVLVRWGYAWFGLSLSVVLAVMMFCYVTVPARLIGMRSTHSKRDSLTASAVGGATGAVKAITMTASLVSGHGAGVSSSTDDAQPASPAGC
jgi:hypothetical protein